MINAYHDKWIGSDRADGHWINQRLTGSWQRRENPKKIIEQPRIDGLPTEKGKWNETLATCVRHVSIALGLEPPRASRIHSIGKESWKSAFQSIELEGGQRNRHGRIYRIRKKLYEKSAVEPFREAEKTMREDKADNRSR